MGNVKHWTELNGNRFLVRPNEAMLLEHGFLRKQSIIIDRRNRQAIQGYVIYDRDYVMAYLMNIFTHLNIQIDDALTLVSDGYIGEENLATLAILLGARNDQHP